MPGATPPSGFKIYRLVYHLSIQFGQLTQTPLFMKNIIKLNAILAISCLVPALVQAAAITLTGSDAINTSSLNSAGKWSNTQAPVSTNDYYTGAFFARTPGDGGNTTTTFAGNSLTLQQVSGQGSPQRSLLFKGGGGDTIVINNLTNATGGVLNNGGSGNVSCTFTGNLWTIAGNSTLLSDQGSTIIGYPLAGTAILTNTSGQSRTITYTGNLSGFTGKFYINSSVTVILSTGSTPLGNPAVFTPDQIDIGAGCTLQDNAGLTFNNPNSGITLAGNATINAGSTTVIAEPITDNGGGYALTAAGAGTLVLSGANTYSGGTVLSSGILQVGAANALPGSGQLTVNGGTFDLASFSPTIDALNGAGTVDTSGGGTPTLTIGANGGSGTFTGLIQNTTGTLALTKIGAGTETLSGGYTYSGQTLVAGGALSLNTAGSLPSTAGNMVISNGAILTVNTSTGIPLPTGNFVVGSNSTLNLTLSTSANGINATGGLTFQDNATNNFIFGSLTANPTVIPIVAAGGLSAPGTNIVLNISAAGLQGGTFTLIKYTGTPLGSVANFTLSLPPGIVGTLINNAGNHSVDVQITAVPNQLAWNGVNGATWDLATANWTNLLGGGITFYRQYTNSSVVAGDGVLFDDTLTNDFVHPQPTNITVTGVFSPFPVNFNGTLPYTLSGPGGITGPTSIVISNTGSVTLLTSNSFTGGVFVDAGALIITNDSALGASAGAVTLNGSTLQVNGNATNSRAFSLPSSSSFDVAANDTLQLNGKLTGAGGLTKIDNGTLVLTGSNGLTGTLIVSQGSLSTSGTNILPAVVTVGNNSGVNAVLNINGGVFNAQNNGGQYASSLLVGSTSGSAGDVRLSSGTLLVNQQLGLGAGAGGYSAMTISGGTVSNGSYVVVGFNNDSAVLNLSGGSFGISNNLMTIAAGGTGSTGVANLSGGTFSSVNGTYVGEFGNGTLNVSGSAAMNLIGTGLRIGQNSGASGTANLNGGTVTTVSASRGSGTAALNFNGGTLKAGAASSTFVSGLSSVTLYSKGATIDDGGFAVTVPQALLAPSGYGVSSIAVTTGGTGYIDTPMVTISGGTGSGATATATVSGGAVTAIVVTCPGTGYASGDALSVTISGGGGSGAAAGTPVLAANVSGGLTKKGAGTLTLSGINTFTGPITNSAGTLLLNSASTYAGGLNVAAGTVSMTTTPVVTGSSTLSSGGTLSISQSGSGTSGFGNLTLNGTATLPGATIGLAASAANNPAVALVNCGTLTLNGTNTISLAGSVKVGTIALIRATGALAGSGNITNLALPQGASGTISSSFDGTYTTISAVISSTGPGIVWTGTNAGSGLTNLWDINSTVNWLLGSTPTKYQQTIIPGDAVTFNDNGSGTVILNSGVGPSGLTISNNVRNYVFNGSGNISGPTGLLKLGTGTTIVNLTNNSYLGNTTVSNGTLQLGSLTALSPNSSLALGAGGTVELSGFNQTMGELTGSGTVDNSTGINPIITFGTSSGGIWNGTVTNVGSAGIAFTKQGTGTWIVGGNNYFNDDQPFNTQDQINAGTVIITNGGLLSVPTLELRIANGAGDTATVVVAGGSLVVTNNPLSVGVGTNATGTLIVNSGTVIAGTGGAGTFAGSPNDIVIGANGANGTMIVNGGQVINSHDLWVGQNAGASAAFYLNGGLVEAATVATGGSAPASSVAYFNGGTLLAATNNASYLQVQSMVMSNGLVLDDGGWSLNISAPLQAGDAFNGGLVKQGAGSVYLDAPNAYTGTTLVTNGLLAGTGTIVGPVVVAPAGVIGAGDAGTAVGSPLTINNDLTVQGTAMFRISKNGGSPASDQIIGLATAHYGGTLMVSNVTTDATQLQAGDTFTLFSATGHSGNFATISGSPGAGLAYTFDPTGGVLSVIATASNPTNITFSVSGSSMTLSWPSDHLGWILQSQTNSLSTGLTGNWTDVNGSSAVTSINIGISPATPTVFFRLRHP